MRKLLRLFIALAAMVSSLSILAQVNVDVNLNIKHSVNGVSDFGRDRHMLIHSALTEPDWEGEEDKMKYLLEDLDTYFGRDNGSATWHFQQTPGDPSGEMKPDYDEMNTRGAYWRAEHEKLAQYRLQYESKATEMIMGTNPHPTYPTLSWYDDGFTTVEPKWQPKDIQTSADWVVEYLDKYFAKSQAEDGKQLPKYWEVINEPDMLFMTGSFMVTSQEKIWEYHNLVAEGVKARLGNNAPLIGGMTWGLHDLPMQDGLSRFAPNYYDQWIDDPDGAAFYREAAATSYYDNRNSPWYQWDVMWKGFIDACGANMDFYGVHIYDWPRWESNSSAIRAGGHTEAMLDMIEWYDIKKFGKRKPIVISEYGAVTGYIGNATAAANPSRRDWENVKVFSQMLLQFLERPDYLVKTIPFTPIKATWGDWSDNPVDRYPYHMLDDRDGDGNWEWSEFIKFFELWSDVKGTRVDTKTTDLDLMADCYINGDVAYVILSNLELEDKTINLHIHGENSNNLQNVRIKHLYLSGDKPTLSDNTQNNYPGAVILGAEATMILAYDYSSNITINQTSKEKKYYGNSLSGTVPHRVKLSDAPLTAHVNGVNVPSTGEAMLRIGGNFYWTHITNPDSRNFVRINGHDLKFNNDWRGEQQGNRNTFFGVLEVEVPVEYLSTNNTISCQFLNVCEYTQVNIQVWEMSTEPVRTDDGSSTIVDVTGVSVSPGSTTVKVGQIVELSETISPSDATNKMVSWSSSNDAIATVDGSGKVTGVAVGDATIVVTTNDGGHTAASQVKVESAVPTGVSISPSSASTVVGLTKQLTATVVPSNAQDKSVTWSSDNASVASVSSTGLVTANAAGTATITARTNTGGITATCNITVENPPPAVGSPIVLEAENFKSTGGTFNDGTVPYGVNAASDHINYTNSGDYVEYIINASQAGECEIEYMISTPQDNAQIQFQLDGVTVSTDNVANNGGWEDWTSLKAANLANISTGVHTIRIVASGTNEWQWNLDKITLTLGGSPNAVTGVSVSPATKQVLVGENTQLSAIVEPSNATDKSVTWSSNNGSVATVDANGVVTASAEGTATITAKTNDGGYTASSTISVVNNITNLVIEAEDFDKTYGTYVDACGATGFNATSVGVNCVNAGEYAEYNITISDAGIYEIEYQISTPLDGSVIEMQIDGVSISTDNVVNNGDWDKYVPLVATNTAELTSGPHIVRLVPGSNDWQWNLDKFSLTKVGDIDDEDVDVTGVSLSQTSLSLVEGNSATLTETVSPGNATDKSVSWSSNNASVATVSNGVVTAQNAGNATITVTTNDGGYTATCSVTVTSSDVPVTGVSLSPTSLSLVEGNSATLTETVSPGDATNKSVSWSSNNTSVATVSNGVVTAQNAGNATITVTTTDGGYTANCAVQVNASTSTDPVVTFTEPTTTSFAAPANVYVAVNASDDGSISNVKLYLNTTLVRQENVAPYEWNAPNQNMDGILQSLTAGTYTLRAVATDNDGDTGEASMTITVGDDNNDPDPNGVTLNQSSISLDVAGTYDLNETVTPPDAADKSVTWSSSNTDVATVNSNGVVTAVAQGNATITVTTNVGGHTATCSVAVNPVINDQSAYPDGIAHAIPGSIESVNYDNGGDGVAYHDVNTTNSGSGPRQGEGVDTEYRIAAGNVGWIYADEWLEYTVDVASAGNYKIDVMVASTGNNGAYHIEFNGSDKTGVQNVSATGGWGTFVTQTISGVSLSAGQQVMRVYMDGGSFNIGTITVSSEDIITPTCDVPWAGPDYNVTKATNNWISEVVDISCAESVNISMTAEGVGPMEASDYVNIYYRVDGGSQIAISENANAFARKTVSATNVSGNNVEIIINGYTSYGDETFTVSNISIVDASTKGAKESISEDIAGIRLYPNPAQGVLNLDFTSELNDNAQLIILNSVGRVIMTGRIEVNQHQLDISDLRSGLYILNIVNGNQVINKRFIKK